MAAASRRMQTRLDHGVPAVVHHRVREGRVRLVRPADRDHRRPEQALAEAKRSASDHATPRPAFFLATGDAAATDLEARLSAAGTGGGGLDTTGAARARAAPSAAACAGVTVGVAAVDESPFTTAPVAAAMAAAATARTPAKAAAEAPTAALETGRAREPVLPPRLVREDVLFLLLQDDVVLLVVL